MGTGLEDQAEEAAWAKQRRTVYTLLLRKRCETWGVGYALECYLVP